MHFSSMTIIGLILRRNANDPGQRSQDSGSKGSTPVVDGIDRMIYIAAHGLH